MLIIGIFVLVGLGVIAWLIGSARERAGELEASRTAIRLYSDQVEATLTAADTTIREMATLSGPSDEAVGTIEDDAEGWTTDLQQIQTGLSQVMPPTELLEVNQLFNEAMALYGAAADTFALVPEAGAGLRDQIFTRAAVQRDTASAIYESAIGVLNRMRSERDLPAAGILPPAGPAAGSMEVPSDGSIEVPVEGSEEQEGAEGQDGETSGNSGGAGDETAEDE